MAALLSAAASGPGAVPDKLPDGTPVALFDDRPFMSLALKGNQALEGLPVGLLLIDTSAPPSADARWLTMVLGRKIEQMRGRGTLSDEARNLRRERSLFLAIINSVTDPILLTDTEGRLVVANSRAGRLFAAGDDESDARRRAARLNDSLSSAALSRTVAGMAT